MAKQIKFDTTGSFKTYKTQENAVKAFMDKFGNTDVRFVVLPTDDGRWHPVGLSEKALQNGVHFHFGVMF